MAMCFFKASKEERKRERERNRQADRDHNKTDDMFYVTQPGSNLNSIIFIIFVASHSSYSYEVLFPVIPGHDENFECNLAIRTHKFIRFWVKNQLPDNTIYHSLNL
jgi:hypothetical protein